MTGTTLHERKDGYMGFHCGIVGLPNVGKSTLFNALTSARAEAGNFPFTTIDPNVGIVKMPDPRLYDIASHFNPPSIVPAAMTFVDIAGLVKGASRGEGLGNKFLAHIRESHAIAHVVRCFEDAGIRHVTGGVDPVRDAEIINTELMLADLESVSRRYAIVERPARAGASKEATEELAALLKVRTALEAGTPVRALEFSKEEKAFLSALCLITAKKMMYVANVGEGDGRDPGANRHVKRLEEYASKEGIPVVAICAKLEAEIAELDKAEKEHFLADYGMDEPGLDRVIRTGYELLDLQTYFTAGEKEVRAWTIRRGMKAPQAAGVIHSDFERGFIRAEVYHCEDLEKHGSEKAVKEAGLSRLEGKDYEVRDGDVVFFRFAV